MTSSNNFWFQEVSQPLKSGVQYDFAFMIMLAINPELDILSMGHPLWPIKKLVSYFLASYFMQMKLEVNDLEF